MVLQNIEEQIIIPITKSLNKILKDNLDIQMDLLTKKLDLILKRTENLTNFDSPTNKKQSSEREYKLTLNPKDISPAKKFSSDRFNDDINIANPNLFPKNKFLFNSQWEYNTLLSTGKKIRRVCLTGGPCAGKSSSLLHVKQALEQENVHVIIVPEASNLMFTNSLNWRLFCNNNVVKFQTGLLKTQMALEGIFTETSKFIEDEKDILILCDRGCMDGSAQMELADFKVMIENLGLNLNVLRDSRQDMVLHLETAAKGAEEHFTLDNSAIRDESLDLARLLCNKVGSAQLGHPNYHLITNNEKFEVKLNTVVNRIKHLFNKASMDPLAQQNYYQKYLVKIPSSVFDTGVPDLPVPFEKFFISETILDDKLPVRKLRHRTGLNTDTYTYHVYNDMNNTYKKILNQRQYQEMRKTNVCRTEQDTAMRQRQIFFQEDSICKLETIRVKSHCIQVLRVNSHSSQLKVPHFLNILKDIREDTTFSTLHISQKSFNFDEHQEQVGKIKNIKEWEKSDSTQQF